MNYVVILSLLDDSSRLVIYKVDCEQNTLFKTSKQQSNPTLEKDQDGKGHLKVEPCHVNGKLSCVTGYITIYLVVYNPNFKQIIKRVLGQGHAPTHSSPNCSQAFEKGGLTVQVSCKWIPPYATKQGKRFTVYLNHQFCSKWCCLESSPNNSNLLAPPAEEVGKWLSTGQYSIIFAEELPVKWLS